MNPVAVLFRLSVFSLLMSITVAAQQTQDLLEGYADIHVHQMANLGFGGSIISGEAWGPQEKALRRIPKTMKRGHDAAETATHGHWLFGPIKTIVNGYFDVFTHGEEGHPSFSSWPSTRLWTHQQVYEDWLFRAYQGGFRLMVMLAENSEDFFGRGENHIFLVGSKTFQNVKGEGRTGNDMEALEWQIREAYRFQDYIDQKFHGKGNGWYRIVRDPQEASEVIKSGKMAVILGTEVQHLFNCDVDRPACDQATIIEGLDRLEAMGVNYVFPIHHKLNQFGGPAMFTPVNSGPMEDCPGYKHKCSAIGLTELGRLLIEELTARGMLIDTEHLSVRSFNDTMAIVESRKYPVLAGHVVPFDIAIDHDRTERAKTKQQLERIFNVGGIVAPILGTSAQPYKPNEPSQPIKIVCDKKEGGSADQWANAYLYLKDVANGSLSGASGHIALGADWMGFAGWPGPRDRCDKDQTHEVPLKLKLPERLVPDAIKHTRELSQFEWPDGSYKKKWNYNTLGVAHVGLLPEFFENVQRLGLKTTDLEPFYRSARGVVELWKTARNIEVANDRHHLRWAPQSPFDVLNFYYRDLLRDISAADGLPPICRSRTEHLLGFEQNGKCILVENLPPPPARPSTETIAAYHNGRCLDIKGDYTKEGAKIVQNPCRGGSQQQWLVREVSEGYVQIINNQSGKCLVIKNSSTSEGAIAIQQNCNAKNDQVWETKRFGNTFRLIAKLTNLCLEVRDQSRDDGAAIQQAKCSGASNQQWSIESRRKNDYETLYQADKKLYPENVRAFEWQDQPAGLYTIPVAVDGVRVICKSTDGEHWIGTVTGTACVGKTYAGTPVTTPKFQQLYQAP